MKATDPFYSTKEWWVARAAARRRDGNCCTNCGRSVRVKGTGQVDHVVPRKERPDLALSMANLRTLCTTCHNARHQKERQAAKSGRPAPLEAIGMNGLPESWQ